MSNSSSSSFLIKKEDLTPKQIKLIKSHRIKAQKVLPDHYGELDAYDEWRISENDYYISGFTWMDNFDFYRYLDTIGVDMKQVKWDDIDLWQE